MFRRSSARQTLTALKSTRQPQPRPSSLALPARGLVKATSRRPDPVPRPVSVLERACKGRSPRQHCLPLQEPPQRPPQDLATASLASGLRGQASMKGTGFTVQLPRTGRALAPEEWEPNPSRSKSRRPIPRHAHRHHAVARLPPLQLPSSVAVTSPRTPSGCPAQSPLHSR